MTRAIDGRFGVFDAESEIASPIECGYLFLPDPPVLAREETDSNSAEFIGSGDSL